MTDGPDEIQKMAISALIGIGEGLTDDVLCSSIDASSLLMLLRVVNV